MEFERRENGTMNRDKKWVDFKFKENMKVCDSFGNLDPKSFVALTTWESSSYVESLFSKDKIFSSPTNQTCGWYENAIYLPL